jgi:hypothetical protein
MLLYGSDRREGATLILCGETAGGSGKSSSAATVKIAITHAISILELRISVAKATKPYYDRTRRSIQQML